MLIGTGADAVEVEVEKQPDTSKINGVQMKITDTK